MGELDEKLVEKSESQSGSVLWNSFRRLSLYFSYVYSMYEASATPLVDLVSVNSSLGRPVAFSMLPVSSDKAQ
jgi:hypothetical protein